jgi:hypothetical protein
MVRTWKLRHPSRYFDTPASRQPRCDPKKTNERSHIGNIQPPAALSCVDVDHVIDGCEIGKDLIECWSG